MDIEAHSFRKVQHMGPRSHCTEVRRGEDSRQVVGYRDGHNLHDMLVEERIFRTLEVVELDCYRPEVADERKAGYGGGQERNY